MEIVDYGNPAYDMEGEFECPECGTPVENEYQHCSRDCFKASMI
jgi:hypothetical protein